MARRRWGGLLFFLCVAVGCVPGVDQGVQTALQAQEGTQDITPHFSPDGETIVFSSNRAGSDDIWIMNSDGTGVRPLTQGPAEDLDPRFSPDGDSIVFDSDGVGGPPRLWVMDADGSDPRPVSPPADGGSIFPSWAPNGTELVFACGTYPALDICIQSADGGTSRTVVAWPRSREWEPSWNPDISRIVFVSDAGGDDNIYKSDTYGGSIEKLTSNSGRDADPAWSPDGNQIAFDSAEEGSQATRLFVIRADGSDLEQVTEIDSVAPAWSPDAETLAFHGQTEWGSGIYLVDLDTGEISLLSKP